MLFAGNRAGFGDDEMCIRDRLVTLSYSGRGIVRPDHTPELMEGDEAQALRSYSEKHNR